MKINLSTNDIKRINESGSLWFCEKHFNLLYKIVESVDLNIKNLFLATDRSGNKFFIKKKNINKHIYFVELLEFNKLLINN